MIKILHKLVQSRLKKSSKEVFDAISNLLAGDNITLVDIGAADGLASRWEKVSSLLHYIGFEPDERSNTELYNNRFSKIEVYRQAVWEHHETLKINLTKKPQNSSYYFPNRSLIDLFPDSGRFNIEGSIELQAIKLDDLSLKSCDFIKIDIQGGELSVLKGAKQLLKKNMGLEIEVEFVSIYSKQPLFGEIVEFLQLHNYTFLDFVNLYRWERDAHSGYGQCVFGDALFLKMPEAIYKSGNCDDSAISKYLSICLLYYRFDLIATFIALLPSSQVERLSSFLNAIKPIRKKHFRVRWLNNFSTRLMRLVGGEDYNSHVLY